MTSAFVTTLAAILDPFRETEWLMTEDLSGKCWGHNQRRWHLLIKQTKQKVKKKDSAMAALMRSTDEEMER